MALNCDIKEQIFTFNGKDYSYNEFRALMYDGLMERVPELTAKAKETLATEEGKAEVAEKLTKEQVREKFKRGLKGMSATTGRPQAEGETPVDAQAFMDAAKAAGAFNSDGAKASDFIDRVLPKAIRDRYSMLYNLIAQSNVRVVMSNGLAARTGSYYAYRGGYVYLDPAVMRIAPSMEDVAEGVNHELIHALGDSVDYKVMARMQKDLEGVFEVLSKNRDKASEGVKAILDYIESSSKERLVEEFDEEGNVIREQREFEEIITYAFTNREFAEFLKSIEWTGAGKEGPKTLWNKLKELVLEFMQGAGFSSSALERVTDIVNEYFTEQGFKSRFPTAERQFADAGVSMKDEAFDGIEDPKTPIGDTKTVVVNGVERTVFNSEGRPIHPTVEGVRNFWRWFGESKVVDAEGRPLVVYHGSPIAGTEVFDPEEGGKLVKTGLARYGTYFTDNTELASEYAAGRRREDGVTTEQSVYPVYLKIDNPVEVNGGFGTFGDWVEKLNINIGYKTAWGFDALQVLAGKNSWVGKNPTNDGLIVKNTADIEGGTAEKRARLMGTMYATFRPNQIKSATGNYGRFDPANPSIRRMAGPREGKVINDVNEYNDYIDAGLAEIESLRERTFSQLSNSEVATRMADAAVTAMEKSKWFKELGIEKRGAEKQLEAVKELRNEIADRFGVKLAPKTQKQQERAEEAAFKKGEKTGKTEEKEKAQEREKTIKEKAKEQAKRLKDKIAEAMAEAKAGRVMVKTKERELSEAAKREQKRIDRAYSQGIASGTLGGEIFGKKQGRKEGAKEMAKEQRLARKNFVAAVREALTDENGKPIARGEVGARKAAAIGAMAAKVDPMNSEQVSKFISYVQKVIADANYDKNLNDAKSAKAKLKAMAKRKSLQSVVRGAAYDLSLVDLDMIDSLEEYMMMANKVLGAGSAPSTKIYEAVNVEEVAELLTDLEEEIDSNYRNQFIEEFGLSDLDITTAEAKELYRAFMEGDIDTAIDKLNDEKSKATSDFLTQKAEEAKAALEEWAKDNGILGVVIGSKFSQAQVQAVKDLLSADPSNMTNAQKSEYIRALDNLVVNDNFGGLTKVAAVAWASGRAKRALNKFGPVFKKFNIGTKLESLRKGLLSMPDLNVMFFGRDVKVGELQVQMGLEMFRRGRELAQQTTDQIAKDQAEFYSDLHAKNPEAASESNLLAEGMVAYIIQKSPAFSAEDSFEINKSIFRENIKKLAASNKKTEKRQAEILEKQFDALVKDAKTREEVLENLKNYSAANHESLMFLIAQQKKYKDAIREGNELNWDSPSASNDWESEYYLPIRYEYTVEEPDFAEKNQNSALAVTLRSDRLKKPVQSFGLRRRQRYKSLPKNMTININVRRNAFNSLSSNIWDTNVTPALYRIQEFLKTPDAIALLGGAQNASFYIEQLNRRLDKYADTYKASEGEKALNYIVNGVRRLSTTYAMSGVVEPVLKQGVEPIVAGALLTGDPVGVIRNIGAQAMPGAQRLMANYSIGSRGANAAYKEWQGKIAANVEKLQQAISNNRLKKAEIFYKKLTDLMMLAVGVTDAVAAKANWMAYYESARKKQGHAVEDWDAEADNIASDEDRQAAAMYAETMTGRTLSVSDPSEASALVQKGKNPYSNLFKAAFMPFSSYNIQKLSRKLQDLKDSGAIFSSDPAKKAEAKRAMASFTTSLVQDATFLAVTHLVIPNLRVVAGLAILSMVEGLLADDDADDEEKVSILEQYIRFTAAGRLLGYTPGDVNQWVKKASEIQQERIKDKLVKNAVNTILEDDPEYREMISLHLDIKKQTEKERKAAIAAKKAYTQMTTSLLMIDAFAPVSETFIHAVNSAYYSILVSTKDPSVRGKDGKPKKFEQWAKDEMNIPLWRFGANKELTTGGGLFDILGKMPSTLKRDWEKSLEREKEAERYYLYPAEGETKEQYNTRLWAEIDKIEQDMVMDGVEPELAKFTVENALNVASELYLNESDSDELREKKALLLEMMKKQMAKKGENTR
jgi:hypothetical protein